MPSALMATLVLTAGCAAIGLLTFRRHRDGVLAAAVALLVFVAFLLGSLFHPVALTRKRLRTNYRSQNASGTDSTVAPPLDQQALDNLPNITLPADGNIDFVAVKDAAAG